jgi:hypothetical protein
MNLILEKERIKQEIDQVNDESIILTIEKVLGLIKDTRLEPLTKEDIIARASKSEDDIKDNRFITLKELENEMKNWQ